MLSSRPDNLKSASESARRLRSLDSRSSGPLEAEDSALQCAAQLVALKRKREPASELQASGKKHAPAVRNGHHRSTCERLYASNDAEPFSGASAQKHTALAPSAHAQPDAASRPHAQGEMHASHGRAKAGAGGSLAEARSEVADASAHECEVADRREAQRMLAAALETGLPGVKRAIERAMPSARLRFARLLVSINVRRAQETAPASAPALAASAAVSHAALDSLSSCDEGAGTSAAACGSAAAHAQAQLTRAGAALSGAAGGAQRAAGAATPQLLLCALARLASDGPERAADVALVLTTQARPGAVADSLLAWAEVLLAASRLTVVSRGIDLPSVPVRGSHAHAHAATPRVTAQAPASSVTGATRTHKDTTHSSSIAKPTKLARIAMPPPPPRAPPQPPFPQVHAPPSQPQHSPRPGWNWGAIDTLAALLEGYPPSALEPVWVDKVFGEHNTPLPAGMQGAC